MIVTKFGKFRYNYFPMGISALGDIFQANIDKLLCDIEGVKTYFDDIIVLSKDSFENHIGQLIILLDRLRAVGLEVNSPKCSFGLKEIPYLGYVLTRYYIKPDTEIVQGIMDLGRPATTTESQAIIGMVHYYRDIWPMWSYILSSLTEVASGPKRRKNRGTTH